MGELFVQWNIEQVELDRSREWSNNIVMSNKLTIQYNKVESRITTAIAFVKDS